MKPEQDNAQGAYSSSGFSFKLSNKQPASEMNANPMSDEMPDKTKPANSSTSELTSEKEPQAAYEQLTEREIVERLHSLADEERLEKAPVIEASLDDEEDVTHQGVDDENTVDAEPLEKNQPVMSSQRETYKTDAPSVEEYESTTSSSPPASDSLELPITQPELQNTDALVAESEEKPEASQALDERYLELQSQMLELLKSIKDAQQNETLQEVEAVDASGIREMDPVEFEQPSAHPVEMDYEVTKTAPLKEEESFNWSGWITGTLAVIGLGLGLGVLWWVVSSVMKQKETVEADTHESLDTDKTDELEPQTEDPQVVAEEPKQPITETPTDNGEETPKVEENAKPTSKHIEMALEGEGESPYSIGKEGFYFHDKDDDPLRGFVIKSVPDEGVFSANGEVITEETFFKIDSLDDLSELDMTYTLMSGDSPGVLEFAFVSGENVIEQQFSDNYQLIFERVEASAQAGPAYAFIVEVNDTDTPPIPYQVI
ncbi:MAG: hypothetical protein OXE99_03420 [Cellvibrionales bacterium]|nr:hypothetical protein [Cellvibrionales bacterium]